MNEPIHERLSRDQIRRRSETIRTKKSQLSDELERWAAERLGLKPGEHVAIELIVNFSTVEPVQVRVDCFDLADRDDRWGTPPSDDEWKQILDLYPTSGPHRLVLALIREQNGAPFSESALFEFVGARLKDSEPRLPRSWPQILNAKFKKANLPFRIRPIQIGERGVRETIRVLERLKV